MRVKLSASSSKKLTVLDMELVSPSEPIGRLRYELACELGRRGHKVVVVTPFSSRSFAVYGKENLLYRLARWEEFDNFLVLRVLPRKSLGNTLIGKVADHVLIPISLVFWSLVAVRDVDVVHCSSPPLLLAFGACLVSAIKRVPLVVRVHDLHPDALVKMNVIKNSLLIGVLKIIEKFVYLVARRITVIAETYKSFIISRGISSRKVQVVPNWFQISSDSNSLTNESNHIVSKIMLEGKFAVTYGGSLYWAQDLETVIDAAYLLRQDKDILFLIVGDGPKKQGLVERAKRLKLKNVVFIPFQSRKVYMQIIHASQACIVTLNNDYTSPTLPSKVPEIMGLGKPIIVNAPYGSEVANLVGKAACGLIVETGDPKSFAEAVLKLTREEALARKLGDNGKLFAEKYFSPTICISKYEELLRSSKIKQ